MSTVCLQDTHPPQKNSTPLPQEISELSTAPISAGLMECLNIARAKPYFRFFFYSLFKQPACYCSRSAERKIRSISQGSIRTLCSFLSKGRPGSSEVGGASAASAHRGTSPWTDSSPKQAAALRRTTEKKGKATALKEAQGEILGSLGVLSGESSPEVQALPINSLMFSPHTPLPAFSSRKFGLQRNWKIYFCGQVFFFSMWLPAECKTELLTCSAPSSLS